MAKKRKATVRSKPRSQRKRAAAPALPAELAPIRDEFLEVIDAGEGSEWKLGDLANRSTSKVEASKFGSMLKFYGKVIKAARPEAPSYSSVTLYARVAKVWPDEFAFLGVSKLGAALTWCHAAQIHPPDDPRLLKIPVTTKTGSVEKPFEQCTRVEIQAAAAALDPTPPPKMPAEVRDVVHKLMAAIQLIDKDGPAHINVKLNGPEPILDIAGLPFSQVRDIVYEMYFAFFPLPPGDS